MTNSKPDRSSTPGATRAVYDHSAGAYVDAVGTELNPQFETAADIAFLDDFAAEIEANPGQVLDVGCGPGRVAAHLAHRGLDMSGVDLSQGMIDQARAAHPNIPFSVAALDHLPAETGSLAGAVLWYSIIHTSPADLAPVWAELMRVLRPGGLVVVAFQAGDGDRVDRPDAHGSSATLTSFRHSPDEVARSLEVGGLSVDTMTVREAQLAHETTPRAFVVARVG